MPNKKDNTICVIGLGTIGLPLAREFARKVKVIGYDVDSRKKGLPVHPGENLFITDDPRHINKADFVLIAVPTPLTRAGKPDLSFLRSASRAVAGNLKP
ncbi:MAG: nucleotide sugar dehydrogenase, partial [Chloroflexi bacterium]|nr:nucleotide sugar dehydrogenase [Chloroflexota bacterium]